MGTQTHSGLVGCVVDIVATSNVRSWVWVWPALTCTVSVHKTCMVTIKKRQNGVWPFPVVSLLSSGFSHHVGLLQEPGECVPPRQCTLHSWRRNAAELILLILAQCTCVGHNIVCPLRDDCDGCVFINCNINNTVQYIWCFLATIPRSANTWLVQSQIQTPCKPDTLLNALTSLLWFVMLQIEHKTVHGLSVRFKWILKVFSLHWALFYTVDFLAYLQIKS